MFTSEDKTWLKSCVHCTSDGRVHYATFSIADMSQAQVALCPHGKNPAHWPAYCCEAKDCNVGNPFARG